MIGLLALIIVGGTAVPTGVFAVARKLVYRQTDPARGEAYLQWFRAEKERERAEQVRALLNQYLPTPPPQQTRPRQKELTRR